MGTSDGGNPDLGGMDGGSFDSPMGGMDDVDMDTEISDLNDEISDEDVTDGEEDDTILPTGDDLGIDLTDSDEE
jgi:hypothetical protein